jgi:hypothetical protein
MGCERLDADINGSIRVHSRFLNILAVLPEMPASFLEGPSNPKALWPIGKCNRLD